jgi:ATP-dependent Clp protease ATP-binding subunit ClpB
LACCNCAYRKQEFKQIQQRLHEAGINLEATDEVLDYLGEQGFDPQFGARPLKSVILNELSKRILSGKVSKDAGRCEGSVGGWRSAV